MISVIRGRRFPPGGVEGELVYATRRGDFTFKLSFSNPMMGKRDCTAQMIFKDTRANRAGGPRQERSVAGSDAYWDVASSAASSSGVGSVAKFWTVEVNTDQSENNEVTLNMRQIKGEKAIAARADYVQKHGGGEAQYEMHAKDAVKSGVLLKNRPRGFQLVWQPRFFVLSKRFLVYYLDQRTREEHPERCVSISSVMRA